MRRTIASARPSAGPYFAHCAPRVVDPEPVAVFEGRDEGATASLGGPKGATLMAKVRVNAFSISLDGFAAGPGQALEQPMGIGGMALHQWIFGTRTFQKMLADMAGTAPDGTGRADVDDAFGARGMQNLGAWILGRNMFGPVRGPWVDDSWKGWWGNRPPYQVPVFVLTHHAHAPLTMEGGTTFHFVTDGIHAALERAKEAAGGKDVRIGGGAATIRQYLSAGLIDELHLVITPALLGQGEPLLHGIDLVKLGYECKERTASENGLHVVLAK
jgi:dihydrofolate reductase